ncbi:MAG: murein transglycosylase, partial [Stellaceae bacterium]
MRRGIWTAMTLGAALGVALVSGCVTPTPPKPKLTLKPVSFTQLPGWHADHVARAIPALLKS